jgi:hypothetical protein
VYKDGRKFEELSIEHQEMFAEAKGMTLEEYKAYIANPPKIDMSGWTEEHRANAIAKFTTPSTSIVTHKDGSRTVYQAPSSDDQEGKWEIYKLEEKTDAQQFEELFGD